MCGPFPEMRANLYRDLVDGILNEVKEQLFEKKVKVKNSKVMSITNKAIDGRIEEWTEEYFGANYDDLMERSKNNKEEAMEIAKEETIGNLYENCQEELIEEIINKVKGK